MLPVANFARRHMARLSATGRDGIEHYYLLRWTDETAVEVLASFIRQSSLPGHPLTPTTAGGFIAALRADGRIDWPTIREAYKLAHQMQMGEAAAIVYGGVEVKDVPVSCPTGKAAVAIVKEHTDEVKASKSPTAKIVQLLNQLNHVRAVDCGAAVEPTNAKESAALDAVDRSSAVAEEIDHRQGWWDREAPARIGRRARVSIFLLGIFQAAIVAAAIAAFVFTFAWGD